MMRATPMGSAEGAAAPEHVSALGGLASAERALVERARAGDAVAFRRLFDQHASQVRRFLRDLLRDGDMADEATQETFVRVHAHLNKLRDEQKLLPWLLGIARNVAREALRRRRTLRLLMPWRHNLALLPLGQGQGGEQDTDDVATTADGGPSPEKLLIGRETSAQIEAALGALAEERRTALLLHIDHGLDYEEIRSIMGWNITKVKNEIHRARVELRKRLGAYLGGEP